MHSLHIRVFVLFVAVIRVFFSPVNICVCAFQLIMNVNECNDKMYRTNGWSGWKDRNIPLL